MQARNRRERRFCISRNFFALDVSRPDLTISKFTHFKPQFTHFKHRQPPMKWQKKTKLFLITRHDFTEKIVILHARCCNNKKRYA